MSQQCIHAVVTGIVQGVFFRDYTRRKAQELELTGWVKNLDDGCVEITACGDSQKVAIFSEWLWQGSPDSAVENVEWRDITLEDFDEFSILRD